MPIYALDGDAPALDAGAWVAPTAFLIGRVRLGADASVWWGSVLRADNDDIVVGPRTNVQDLSVLHVDPGQPLHLDEGVTVGHRATLHGCQVESGALIGIGATVLNGARVGAGALIGAHALVPEGARIPPGTLALGVPARVVRNLSSTEQARIRSAADRYVENARRHRAGLKSV